jgi:predicted O-methyltransferase YrrM
MTDEWNTVDTYLCDTLLGDDPVVARVLATNRDAGLPAIDVAPNQGKLLMLLACVTGARTVLEVGTLGGYSTIWLARGVGGDGHVVTLEANPRHAEVARTNINGAELSARVDVLVGPALDTLPGLVDHDAAPFAMVFSDADKVNNARYLEWGIRLGRPGTLIVCDNVVRGGRVVDGHTDDESVVGTRALLDALAADPRVDATAIQTVGSKGWDGFALAVVNDVR